MRIAIDARELCGRPTGVGRYLTHLLDEWERTGRARELTLYAPVPPSLTGGTSARVRLVPGRPGTWWEQVRLAAALAADRPDVLFAPAYSAPLRVSIPTVLTIHDLSYMAHPEWFSWREGVRRRWLTARAARRAALVLTVSEFSRQEILTRLRLPAARVRTILPGLPQVAAPGGSPPVTDHPTPLVLFVGSIFNRRHVPDLIRAFAPIAQADPSAELIVVGENRTHPREDLAALVRTLGLDRQVGLHPYATDDALAQFYGRARVFVFLSDYEGFGFTPLEALQAGAPIVVQDTPVAREIDGDAAVYVERGDIAGGTAAIRQLLYDEEARRTRLAAAPAVLARYSWERAAAATMAAIEEAAVHPGAPEPPSPEPRAPSTEP